MVILIVNSCPYFSDVPQSPGIVSGKLASVEQIPEFEEFAIRRMELILVLPSLSVVGINLKLYSTEYYSRF